MAKRKKPQKTKKPKARRSQVLTRKQINISGEVDYVIKLAQSGDSRIVRLGSLIFFSTASGDAWLLDPEDELALCLARGGEKQAFRIMETESNFSIEWNAQYQIDGDAFIVAERSGRIRTIYGYPTGEILDEIRSIT